jgi:dynein heavy chain
LKVERGVDTNNNLPIEISENASKEYGLESALSKMEREWEALKLIVVNYKSRGVLIL